jgi:PPOX class probable F420-dependent enzyme
MASLLSEKARTFLQERRFAVLATINADGTPQLTTMWYLLEDDTIIMNTRSGRLKYRNILRDPRVSLCIEDEYSYLTINGTVEVIDNQETALKDIYRLAVRYNGEDVAQKQMAEQFSKEPRATLRLRCEHSIENI